MSFHGKVGKRISEITIDQLWFSTADLRKLTGLNPQTIQKYLMAGYVQYRKTFSGRYLIDRPNVEKLLKILDIQTPLDTLIEYTWHIRVGRKINKRDIKNDFVTIRAHMFRKDFEKASEALNTLEKRLSILRDL